MNEETKTFVEQTLLKHLGHIPKDFTFLGTSEGQHASMSVLNDILTALNIYEDEENG